MNSMVDLSTSLCNKLPGRVTSMESPRVDPQNPDSFAQAIDTCRTWGMLFHILASSFGPSVAKTSCWSGKYLALSFKKGRKSLLFKNQMFQKIRNFLSTSIRCFKNQMFLHLLFSWKIRCFYLKKLPRKKDGQGANVPGYFCAANHKFSLGAPGTRWLAMAYDGLKAEKKRFFCHLDHLGLLHFMIARSSGYIFNILMLTSKIFQQLF